VRIKCWRPEDSWIPNREWDILERIAVRGPLNASRIAKGERRDELALSPSTTSKCLSHLLADQYVCVVTSRMWRKHRIPYYGLSDAGLSTLLTSIENWNRLQTILAANTHLLITFSQRRLLNAWTLMQVLPKEVTERVIAHYSAYVAIYMHGGRRGTPPHMREVVRQIIEKVPPDPYYLLLDAIVRSSLSESNPDLMFEEHLERKNARESHVKPVIASDKTVQKMIRLPIWFNSLLRRAYHNHYPGLYLDLIVVMKWIREELRSQSMILSWELRRLPRSPIRRDLLPRTEQSCF
jgi:hypothetical protein